ncbi:MAG: DUF1232 domain-containing protein [Chloroflexota bacterium]|nr:DUF1232 domain-containing protein [Chloroflexota bacterium]MDE3102372.1 DUF1232 domain-containing protein [Chloroflexota bacterium]
MSLPGWVVALVIVVLLYLAALAVLFVTGRRSHAREIALLLPNIARLFHGLLRDPDVPWHAKAVVAAGLGYIVFPLDLIPEVIPVIGPLDDAIVASLVLGYVARASGRAPIERHWHGDPRILARLFSFVARGGSPPPGSPPTDPRGS